MKPVILCVDDEKLVLESVVGQLRQHYKNQYAFETAESAEDAHELVAELMEEQQPIHIIISDWLMPIQKGDAFLIEMSELLPEAKLIMLSGHADEDAVERAQKYANLHDFIRKPWDKEHLIGSIDSAFALMQQD
jgi:response regulator RpfG family c-di-GMP phosphodiesterase